MWTSINNALQHKMTLTLHHIGHFASVRPTNVTRPVFITLSFYVNMHLD